MGSKLALHNVPENGCAMRSSEEPQYMRGWDEANGRENYTSVLRMPCGANENRRGAVLWASTGSCEYTLRCLVLCPFPNGTGLNEDHGI